VYDIFIKKIILSKKNNMGGLKPIGSEKLQGMDKIRRIMEIATYNENIPNPINENKATVYSTELADGNSYFIIKEKSGYIIKQGLNESTSDYIEPIQNRKYFSSYSQALKKLNLMAKEFNVLYENEEGMSLFSEQKKKYKLKLPGKKTSAPAPEMTGGEELPPPPSAAEPLPAPPAPTVDMAPPPADTGGTPPPMGAEETPTEPMEPTGETPPEGEPMEPEQDMDMDMEMGDEDMEMGDEEEKEKKPKKDEATSFKVIQKLTGKLAQKIRKFNTEDDMDPNDVKYIINSILSALDVDLLDEDDIEEITSRLEGEFDEDEESDEGDEDMEDTDMEEEPPMEGETMPEEGEESSPEPPEGGEMSEYNHSELDEIMNLGDAITKSVSNKYAGAMYDKMAGMDAFNEEEEYPRHGARKPRNVYNHLEHGTFGESKVGGIISNYFKKTKKEIINEEEKKITRKMEEETRKSKYHKRIVTLSENTTQKNAALMYMKKNPTSKLVGKTNKGSLIFDEGFVKTKVTVEGYVI